MSNFKQAEPARLSGGQKQRVAIAGILALEPEIIILDEATSMLDPKGRAEVLETVKAVKERSNLTVLSITHDINEAAHADRIFVLERSEEHTSEVQSRGHLVCRLLLETKNCE